MLDLAAFAALAGLLAGSALTATARFFWLGEVACSFRWQLGCAGVAVPILLLIARRPVWAGGALLVSAWHLAPSLLLEFGGPPAEHAGPTIEVASVNLLWDNREHDAFLRWVEEERPDLMVLLEVSPAWKQVLDGLQDEYPHRLLFPAEELWHPETWGRAVLSRVPFERTRVIELAGGLSSALEVVVALGDGPLVVRAAHPPRPGREWRNRERDAVLSALAHDVEWGPNHVLIGDLNTSSYSPVFADLVEETGLRDSRRGFGRQPSHHVTNLPVLNLPISAWVTIDHVLVGEGIVVLDRRVGDLPGSDHRTVVARLAR